MSKIDDLKKAGRLARVMASDVAIYNTEKIQRGLETDRLFEEIADDWREAHEKWADQVCEEIVNNTNLLQSALIDQVFGAKKSVASPIF